MTSYSQAPGPIGVFDSGYANTPVSYDHQPVLISSVRPTRQLGGSDECHSVYLLCTILKAAFESRRNYQYGMQ